MLRDVILDRVDSISNLGVIMDSGMSFAEHVNIAIGKALALMGFVMKKLRKFKDF
jgi:hypothetical protein